LDLKAQVISVASVDHKMDSLVLKDQVTLVDLAHKAQVTLVDLAHKAQVTLVASAHKTSVVSVVLKDQVALTETKIQMILLTIQVVLDQVLSVALVLQSLVILVV
jgi:hypothetical protein